MLGIWLVCTAAWLWKLESQVFDSVRGRNKSIFLQEKVGNSLHFSILLCHLTLTTDLWPPLFYWGQTFPFHSHTAGAVGQTFVCYGLEQLLGGETVREPNTWDKGCSRSLLTLYKLVESHYFDGYNCVNWECFVILENNLLQCITQDPPSHTVHASGSTTAGTQANKLISFCNWHLPALLT